MDSPVPFIGGIPKSSEYIKDSKLIEKYEDITFINIHK